MKQLVGLLATIILLTGGCKVAQKTSIKDPVIATVGQSPIYKSEFQYVYDKNSLGDSANREKSLREYLDLYVNFRLKVLEAEKMGLDTAASFQQELSGYTQQLAEPFLQDSTVTNRLVIEAYQRLKEEIRARHILLNVPPDADPKDTLAAYQKITQIQSRAASGEDFDKLAREFSQDPSAAGNGGDLGYFTALQMVYPFEDAAFRTKKGQVTQPFRTRFGYHILQVTDRRPAQGRLKVAHIMVRTNPETTTTDSAAARQKIEEIYRRLNSGERWEGLVTQFSEDGASRSKDGVLPPFTTGNMIPSFEEAAFALQKSGDVSRPVLTPYGWHIIRLVEKQPLEPFNELEAGLRQKVSRDSRSELNKSLLLNRLKKENKLIENQEAYAIATKYATDSLKTGTWSYQPDKSLQKTLFTIGGQPYPIEGFFEFVKQNQQPKPNVSPAYYLKVLYDEYVNQSLLAYEKAHLTEKYPEYKYVVKEYRDGMLLFQQMESRIWSRSLTDSTGQQAYFEQNQDKYQWKQRVTASVYNAANREILTEVQKLLPQKLYPVNETKFNDIYFNLNTSELSGEQKAQLDNLIQAVKPDTSVVLEVAGYADVRENEKVSGNRAKAVTDYLVSNGLAITQIVIKDYERFKPVSRTDRRKNSRAGIQVFSTSKTTIERQMNARKPLNLEITEGKFQKGDNPYVDQVEWKPGNYTVEPNNRVVYMVITDVEAPRPKTFEEARGSVIADYQAYLEKEWLDTLRKENPVVLNEKEIQKLLE